MVQSGSQGKTEAQVGIQVRRGTLVRRERGTGEMRKVLHILGKAQERTGEVRHIGTTPVLCGGDVCQGHSQLGIYSQLKLYLP